MTERVKKFEGCGCVLSLGDNLCKVGHDQSGCIAPMLAEALDVLLKYLEDDNPGGFIADSWMSKIADQAKSALAKAYGEKE